MLLGLNSSGAHLLTCSPPLPRTGRHWHNHADTNSKEGGVQRIEATFPTTGELTLFECVWLPDSPPRGTVVLVHGYAEHCGRYDHVAAYLTGRGYAVYALDLRGHGRSEGPRTLVRSFNEYLDDVDALLARVREHASAPLFLLGHSMGGCIVSLSAVTRRPAVAGIVLSGAVLQPPRGVQALLLRVLALVAKPFPRLGLTTLDSALVSRDPAEVAKYDADPLNYRGKVPLGTAIAMMRAVGMIRKRAPSITAPLLILHGSTDGLADPEGSHWLYEHAGSGDKMRKVYEGLYHEILNEPEKDLVMSDIAAWLDRHTTAP
jgi:alpha-beta hydrolase superfamily lysophospholipase